MMTRHERCLATLRCQPVDRLPAYLPAIACEVATALLGRPSLGGTGSLHVAEARAWMQGEAAHAEWLARFEQDMIALHRALDLDVFREPFRMRSRPARQLDANTFVYGDEEGEHSIWRYIPETADFSPIRTVRPPRSPQEQAAALLASARQAEAEGDQQAAAQAAMALRWLPRIGDEFFVVTTGAGIGIGLEELDMMALVLAPELVAERMLLMAAAGERYGEQVIAHGAPAAILGGGDLASNQGPMYAPQRFRQVVLPAYLRLLRHFRKLGLHYAFRSDGNLWSLAEMLFADAGCPGYGETDRDATMTIGALRERFPSLVIWGNMPSRLLVEGTPHKVREEARRLVDEADGRGCFQACSNAIVKGTPPANVEALYSIR